MADEDMAGDYFDDEDDFEWFYIEDTLPLADELAETSIPDPGYAGTKAELEDFWDDLDLFAYWDDLEYGHDSYWDSAGTAMTGQKRKRADGASRTPGKARKMTLKETEGGAAMFVRMAERWKLWNRRAPVRKDLTSFSLLPDWRERCVKADTRAAVKPMPVEMKQAAEGNDVNTPEGARHFDAGAMQGEEGDWEDEDEAQEAGDLAGLANIDPEMLKTVLRQKLGDAGLGDMDEGAFMQTMMKMMSAEGGFDEAAGELANSLLGGGGQGDSAFSGWLSQQGVSFDQAEEVGDDADSVVTAEMPEASGSAETRKAALDSPSDSAIEMLRQGRSSQMAVHDGSPRSAKKRLAPVGYDDSSSERKRKKVALEQPASQEMALAGGDGEKKTSEEQAPNNEQPSLMSDAVPNMTVSSKTTRAKAKATNAPAAADNKATTTASKSRAGTKNKVGPAAPAPSGPAKSTRKRKAQAEEAEPPPPAKKQTRKVAATGKEEKEEGGPSYARPTRATRARSGK